MKTLFNFLKLLCLLALVIVFIGCCQEEQSKGDHKYTDMAELLNACDGYAVVVTKGYNEGYNRAYRNWIVIIDSAGKAYTYQGVKYDVAKGDTLIVKTQLTK